MINRIFSNMKYNLSFAFSSSKIPVLLIMLGIIIHDYSKALCRFSVQSGFELSQWIFPLIFNQIYMRRIINIGVVFLFCDLPTAKQNYYFLLHRSGKSCWIAGQFLYIIIMSIMYYFSIFLITILVNIKYIEFSQEWGKAICIVASGKINAGENLYISREIVNLFSPLEAVLNTFVLNVLMASFLGGVILFFNLLFGRAPAGIVASSVMIFIDIITNYYHSLISWSPVTWSNLEYISFYRSKVFVICFYSISFLLIMLISIAYHRKNTIKITEN